MLYAYTYTRIAHTAIPNDVSGCVHFSRCKPPKAIVKWRVQSPLSIEFSKFTVSIYTQDEEDPLCSENVPYDRNKSQYYHELVDNKLANSDHNGKYSVVIEAIRTDDVTVKSDTYPLTTKPGEW